MLRGQNVTISPDFDAARRALLEWWADAGVAPPAAEPAAPARAPARQEPAAPRRAAPARAEAPPPSAPPRAVAAQGAARTAATAADSIAALKAAVEAFEGCALKQTAKTTVFSRGSLASGVMVIGEAPGFEEDARGEPFVGRSGVLLDRMFAAIGLSRDDIYVTNILFWRPPGNRNPSEDDIRACLPFVERHIALASPKVLVLAGKMSAQTMLGGSDGIMRLRGRWSDYRVKDAAGEPAGPAIPALPVLHPAFLLRQPAWKAQTWRDLLSLQAKLEGLV